ncbi:MAG: phenylalanine--tRNA ligase subunit alpha [Actinomycetota bacterium]
MESQQALDQLTAVKQQALAAIAAADDEAALSEAKIVYMGRKSAMAEIGRALAKMDADARRRVGRLANEVRSAVESALSEKALELKSYGGGRPAIDVTLPGRRGPLGRVHPLTEVLDEIIDIFVGLGYQVADGPVVETDYYNFEALNFPPDHPARSMHDTFYMESTGGEERLLRTHTSPVQIRLMKSTPPPLYMVIPGICCRRDEVDANHLSVFNQIEGLAVDHGVSFSDLKGTLEVFARQMFGANLTVRMHPSFFPFTEPSAEVYVSCFACGGSGCRTCGGEGWIEIMGAGMVHPNVLRKGGYDPEISGFAFGMGIERIAKLRYSVTDLRSFYENDVRFLGAGA